MAENELKWYNILKVLFGTILSIADPITDVLTLVEFYRTDHKTWFGVGLTFIILPSLFFLLINYVLRWRSDASRRTWRLNDHEESKVEACKFTRVLVFGCNPLLPAWLKMRTLYSLKKLLKRRQGNNTHQMYGGYSEEEEELDNLLRFSELGVLVEAALESAPQFIIQLYAMAVQQQSVSIVQMVSLPVSFLSLAWASTVADKTGTLPGNYRRHPYFGVKDTVLLFVTHLFILSSRLFAVALFAVSYKWWVISVLILHCTVITICDRVWLRRTHSVYRNNYPFESTIYFCLHWIRDDLTIIHYRLRMQLVSNVLFVIENITMILLFYFSHFPHTWYSLPVTICVCLFAVLGAVMRLTHFYYSQRRNQTESSSRYSIESPAIAAGLQQYVYETSV
ncbi:unnamed protein product [Porites evermanni]|uniref:XK-related protein n=1 Tax=Porites evermanni TaxID=104178 RepID=A0ABN8QPJ4_9CNID|nr:unnamed protein product [Porites evermanni]